MITKSLILLSLVLSIAYCISPIHRCAHEENSARAFGENYRADYEQLRSRILEHKENHPEGKNGPLLRIPVVWHVLHLPDGTYRIPEATIQQEMDYLNQWFSGSNRYYDDSSPFWDSIRAVASDINIQFELAVVDPQLNPFNGINYVETNIADTCVQADIFSSANGGVDLWDPFNYYNIYTCELPGQFTVGYAFFPTGGIGTQDGAVMKSSLIGSEFFSGSTTAHETGHYLGLLHSFGRNNVVNDCDDDGIADTPVTDVDAFQYTVGGESCAGKGGKTDEDFQRCGNIVNNQNIMDYNFEPCITMWTKDQVAFMRTTLTAPPSETVRSELPTSYALADICTTFDCSGKECGPDGCGGTCGTCDPGFICDSSQQCQIETQPSPSPSNSPPPPPSQSPTNSPVSNQQTASRTPTPAANQPSASRTQSPASNQQTASRTPTPAANQPSASRTRSPVSNQQTASRTPTPAANQPSASRTRSPAANQPSASRTPVLDFSTDFTSIFTSFDFSSGFTSLLSSFSSFRTSDFSTFGVFSPDSSGAPLVVGLSTLLLCFTFLI